MMDAFTHGQMVKEFDTASFSQQAGVVGDPVRTQFGYHLIEVIKKGKEVSDDDRAKALEAAKPAFLGGVQ